MIFVWSIIVLVSATSHFNELFFYNNLEGEKFGRIILNEFFIYPMQLTCHMERFMGKEA